jgi:hypothetical protein
MQGVPLKPEDVTIPKDSCLKFSGEVAGRDRIRELELQLEVASSCLTIANRDLDAANYDKMLHSKLRLQLVTALRLDSLPPRGDNSRIFEAIEKLESNDAIHAPGAWHCEKCGFVLQKSVLHAQTGAVSANNEPFNESCPNDGQLMKPLTWKRMSEDNFKAGSAALEREQSLRNILIETRHYSLGHHVPNEWYLKRDKALA